MRDGGGDARVDLAVLEGVRDLADRLVGMGQVVVARPRCPAAARARDRRRRWKRPAALAASGRGRLLRVAAQQPQLDVVDVDGERVVDGFLVGQWRGVGEVGHGVELRRAHAMRRARAG
jgi:hypothetical protein